MANTELNWGQQIDKIAYGVAIVLGLFVLAVPFLFSGSVTGGDLDLLTSRLQKKANDQKRKMVSVDPEDLGALVRSHWSTGRHSRLEVPWVTERPPLFLKLVKKGQGEPAEHHPARLSEIICERDPKKEQVFLRVKGFVSPENQYVKIRRITIERSVDGGPFKKLPGRVKISDEFAYKDYKVEPGKAYSYKVVTFAVPDPEAPEDANFGALTEKQVSEPLGPTEKVPPDYSLEIAYFDDKNVQEPGVWVKLWYWDYKTGKRVGKGSIKFYKEKDRFGSDNRWQFFRIDVPKGLVLVADKRKLGKDTVTAKTKRVPVEAWEPHTPAAPEAPAGEEGGEEFDGEVIDDVEGVTEEAVKPEPKKSRKKKGFRDRGKKARN